LPKPFAKPRQIVANTENTDLPADDFLRFATRES